MGSCSFWMVVLKKARSGYRRRCCVWNTVLADSSPQKAQLAVEFLGQLATRTVASSYLARNSTHLGPAVKAVLNTTGHLTYKKTTCVRFPVSILKPVCVHCLVGRRRVSQTRHQIFVQPSASTFQPYQRQVVIYGLV